MNINKNIGIKITNLKSIGYNRLLGVLENTHFLLGNKSELINIVLKAKEAIELILDKKNTNYHILCSDVDKVIEELINIKINSDNNIEFTENIIFQIKEIRIEIFKLLMKPINEKKSNSITIENVEEKNIYKTDTFLLLEKVESAEELMFFYKERNNNISVSNNIDFLKALINKFYQLKENITWYQFNINRLLKLETKIQKKEIRYLLPIDLVEYSKKNKVKYVKNKSHDNTDSYKEKIINIFKKKINSEEKIHWLINIYESLNEFEIYNNLKIELIDKLIFLIKNIRKISIEETRKLQRFLKINEIDINISENYHILENIVLIEKENLNNANPFYKTEKEAVDYINKFYPEIIFYSNYFYEGIEMDLYFPDLNLNIEIDGKHHMENKNQLNKDIKRDIVLKKDGFNIIRIKSYEDIGNQIFHILTTRYKIIKKIIEHKPIKQILSKKLTIIEKKGDIVGGQIMTSKVKNSKTPQDINEKKINNMRNILSHIKDSTDLNIFYKENSTDFLNMGHKGILEEIINKYNELKFKIVFNSIIKAKIKRIRKKIEKIDVEYKLPEELVEYIEKDNIINKNEEVIEETTYENEKIKVKKNRDNLIILIEQVTSTDELMQFYKNKCSNISNSDNLNFLQILLNKFIEFNKTMEWTKINKNRVKKIAFKISELNPNDESIKKLVEHIKKNEK